MAFPTDYTKKIHLISNHMYIEENLTDFPALVDEKQMTEDFWSEVQSDGGDIRCSSDWAGLNRLSIEIENIDTVEEKLVMWVKIDLSESGTDHLYIWYGSAVSESQPAANAAFGSQSVWNSNFKMVHHMHDDPDNTAIKDSTSNSNNGTKTAADHPIETTSGLIYKAQNFAGPHFGDGENIDCGNDISLQITHPMSVSTWVKMGESFDGERNNIAGKSTSDDFDPGWRLMKDTNNKFALGTSANVSPNGYVVSDNTYTDLDWHNVAFAINSSGVAYLYVDGQKQIDQSTYGAIIDSGTPLLIAQRYYEKKDFNWIGIIDEFRISNIERSDAWFKLEYYNYIDTDNLWGSLGRVDSCSITRIVALNAGDKIKMVGRILYGPNAETADHSVRLKIKKLKLDI